tara:strand:+ start:40 stop:624 length:585 start_codon:yes stop_codon:yes gene_type:complete
MSIIIDPPKLLFPEKVVTSFDNNFDSYKDQLIDWIMDYSKKNPTRHMSNFGGYQSSDQFYLEESFAPYMNHISEHIIAITSEYLREGSSLPEEAVKLNNMWFNINHHNCYNVTHVHPGCILSGCLWVKVPDKDNPFIFESVSQYAKGTYSDDLVESYHPIPGSMCLFPSHLPHRVDINPSKQTRISIAFNLWAP